MKLQIIATTVKDGIMSADQIYFPTLNKEERQLLYESTIERFMKKVGLGKEQILILEKQQSQASSCIVTKASKKLTDNILILKKFHQKHGSRNSNS